MPEHLLVAQLRFARGEFRRCLEGVPADDAVRRLEPLNSLSWIVGHLANQEHGYWVMAAQGQIVAHGLHNVAGSGKPATTPPLDEMWATWHTVTRAADVFLDTLTTETLQNHIAWRDKQLPENVGTLLQRNIYHYWYHLGEAHAIRQMLGHLDLPQFVGDMAAAVYRPEQ